MKKWPIFLAGTAIAIVGCGGGGGKNTSAASSTATTAGLTAGLTSGDSIATPNLPTSVGLVYVYYITGQGRAAGDISATLASAVLKSSDGSQLFDPLPNPLTIQLNQYSQNAQAMDQTGIVNSEFYNEFDLNVASIEIQNSDGSLGPPITGPNGTYFINPTNGGSQLTNGSSGAFTSQIGVFPGRQTSVQIFLDDAAIALDPTQSFYQFYRNIFLSDNTQADNPNIQGFMSDYVMFDITHVATPPNVHLSDGVSTVPATRVYLSGEDKHYGDSTSVVGGPFCVFTPSGFLTGTFRGADTIPNPPTGLPQITQGGTYTLRDSDPRDITGGSRITSLTGIWRPVTSVVNNMGTFEVMTMPHTTDDNNQDIVALVRDANGNITNMYFGIADLSGLTFTVYPIANIETGAVAGAISGTLSGLVDTNGATTSTPANARFGRYSFTGSLPIGFKATGRFFVFRV